MRFHDLRTHERSVWPRNASSGMPPALCATKRGGWETSSSLKRVYPRTFTHERIAVDKKANDYFNSLF